MIRVLSLLTVTYHPTKVEGCQLVASKVTGGKAILKFNDSPTIEVLAERAKEKWESNDPFHLQDWRKIAPNACRLPPNYFEPWYREVRPWDKDIEVVEKEVRPWDK